MVQSRVQLLVDGPAHLLQDDAATSIADSLFLVIEVVHVRVMELLTFLWVRPQRILAA
jgi:hypothetical protein